MKTVILNYRMGNLGSILNMLKKIGSTAIISDSKAEIESADRLILPGVGAFDHGMQHLHQAGFVPLLHRRVLEDKVPLLGICLGMQLLGKSSEEGGEPGLGWIDAKATRFRFESAPSSGDGNLKRPPRVPHVGWNTVEPKRLDSLFAAPLDEERFYFTHSYQVQAEDHSSVLATTHYGYEFVSALQRDNIMGVQFHPEKSHKYGLKLLKNFMERT